MSPRLPGVRPQELIRALEKAGFEFVRQRGSHRTMNDPITDRLVVVPIHPREVPRWLLKKIIKDAGLTEADFRDLL
jgi:predicted RNA binding protein YcfA (HicA-like mRNA interferase family)